jgi:hypothetical protein
MNSRLALVTALCLGAGSPFAGQAAGPMVYGKGNPADWPKERDALIAAPRNHKVLIENDKVADGKIIFDTRTLTRPLAFPLTMYKEPEAPHSVENLSTTITPHRVRVEMKN